MNLVLESKDRAREFEWHKNATELCFGEIEQLFVNVHAYSFLHIRKIRAQITIIRLSIENYIQL